MHLIFSSFDTQHSTLNTLFFPLPPPLLRSSDPTHLTSPPYEYSKLLRSGEMKCYLWSKRAKKKKKTTTTKSSTVITISSSDSDGGVEMKKQLRTSLSRGACGCCRSILPTVLLFGVILPFVFIRIAFVALESPSFCTSLDCIGFGWSFGFFGGSEKLGDEITRNLIEADNGKMDGSGMGGSPSTFNDLVTDMISNKLDIKTFAFKTKAMVLNMEYKVQSAKQQELMYWYLASYGVPKSMHCLTLSLAEEYSVNALARSPLPPPELVYRLASPSYQHFALLTDNVLAASVVVSSIVTNSISPENLVIHIVTDKKTYAPMYAWFALHPANPAVVEVKGLHQFDWPREVNLRVKEMLEIHRSTRLHYDYYNIYKGDELKNEDKEKTFEPTRISSLPLMDQLWVYLPELFPELNRIILMDDDTVVQRDLSPLWEMDLNGSVNGAVVNSYGGEGLEEDARYNCSGKVYGDYLNFSHQEVFSKFKSDRCAWLFGMNVFDLQAWRRTNITENYHHWFIVNLNSSFELGRPGTYPPALIAFEGYVHPIDPSWHVAGLGDHPLTVGRKSLEQVAVLHYSGPAKPWLEIGFPELRNLWNIHINYSNEFIRGCKFWC